MFQNRIDWIPRFKGNLQIIDLGDAGFSVIAERNAFLLEGAAMKRVVPLIDGYRSVQQIMRAFEHDPVAPDVLRAFSILADTGYLEDVSRVGPPAINAVCNELQIGYPEARQILAERPVEVIDLTQTGCHRLRQLMTDSGIRLGTPAALTVLLCDDYRDPRILPINESLARNGAPWLLSKPSGFNVWIGPLLHSPHTACWQCLDHQLTRNRHLERYAERITGQRMPLTLNPVVPEAYAFQGYGALLNQVVRILLGRADPALHRSLRIIDTLNLQITSHPVAKRPECKLCGGTAQSAPYQPSTASQAVKNMGGYRRESPEVTFAKLRHHVDAVTGIVSALDPSPYNSTTPLRVYTAGHNFALANDTPAVARDSIRSMSSGKGRTDADARTSALCEALERYSGMYQGYEERHNASFRELGSAAIDPTSSLLFSEKQYVEREKWLARKSRFQVVPLPFDRDVRIDWSPVKELATGKTRLLPTSQLYYGYPYDARRFFAWADSNGCASGTTFEDACLQGLLELVERDAVAVWWYNQLSVAGHSPHDLGDPYYSSLQAYYASVGREYWVLDLTHDLQIPVFCAVNRRTNGPTEDIIMGFGAHVDRNIAINRAVTEMNQFMPAVLTVGPDGQTQYGFDDADALDWWRTAKAREKPYLLPDAAQKGRAVTIETGAVDDALQCVADRIRKAGLEIYVLDQSRGEVGLPVARMIVPGLRHFWARFAPGRLFDVPVHMGVLKAPKTEDSLNPVPLFV